VTRGGMALLRLKAAAEVLGVHPVTLRRWADEGPVPVVRPGRERRFRTEELERFLSQAPKDIPPSTGNGRRLPEVASRARALIPLQPWLGESGAGYIQSERSSRSGG